MLWRKLGHGIIAGAAGVTALNAVTDLDNRLAGLGPLAGIMTGTMVGVAAPFARPMPDLMPAPLAAVALGATAMAGADGPLVALGLTRPGGWAAADWASDIVPHLGYGAAAYATLTALTTAYRRNEMTGPRWEPRVWEE
jgi:hypothetical protein